MSRRLGLPLGLLVVGALAVGLWLTRRERPTDAPAPGIDRPAVPTDAPPTLLGKREEAPAPEPEDGAPPSPEPPPRPWETRSGFDFGKEGDVRATGRVLFEDGRPAPGATVWKTYVFRPFYRTQAEQGLHDFFVAATKTDADGRYRFNQRQIPSKLGGAALLARHGDQAALLLDPEDDGTHAEIPDLLLGPAIQTRIDVLTVHGDPVPGALGRLEVRLGSLGGADLLLGDLGDDEGRLTFLPLPDSADLQLEVEVKHRQYPDVSQELDVDALRRGEVLRVEMPTGRTVRGRIVDSDGTPPERVFLRVAGYDAEWKRQQLLEGAQGKPDESGAFELHGVPAVESRLLVYRAPADPRRLLSLRDLGAHVFDLAAGRHGEVLDLGDLHLDAPGAIRGAVVGPEGEPLVGVCVDANVPIEGTRIGGSAATDESGVFVIENLPPAGYRLRASHEVPRFGRRETRLDGARPGSAPIELKLTGGSTLVLRMHPQGRRDQDLRIHRFSYDVLSGANGERVSGGGGGGGSIGLGSGGAFREGPGPGTSLLRIKLEPGTRRVRLRAKGYEPVVVGPVEIVEDRDTAVDLEPTPE